MFRVLIVHCSGLSSGRERVRRARVIIALSLATCQYNLEAMRKDGREGGEKREKGNIEKRKRKKRRKERGGNKEEGGKGRGREEVEEERRDGEERGGKGKGRGRGRGINATTTKESRKLYYLRSSSLRIPF